MLKYKIFFLIFLISIISANVISEIRTNYTYIQNNLKNFLEVRNNKVFDTNLSDDSKEAYNYLLYVNEMNKYYEDKKLRKINIKLESWKYKGQSDYFYKNNNLFFVYKIRKYFLRLKNGDLDRNQYTINEYRYYFNKGKMIKLLIERKFLKIQTILKNRKKKFYMILTFILRRTKMVNRVQCSLETEWDEHRCFST